VRGVAAPDVKSDVTAHLEQGCEECRAALQQWQAFADATQGEKSYNPPADVVRMIKREFALQHPPAEKTVLIPQLIFDSLAQPSPVGVRSSGAGARQVLYEIDGVTIDLRIETNPPSPRMVAVGQVMEKHGPRGVPIPLLVFNDRGQAVVETQTTEQGEFEFEFDANEPLRLSIELDLRRSLQLPLRELRVPMS
jgi:hypothetical protein